MTRETALLSAILIIGTAARLIAFSRSAVEHFDEGVYASNLFFGPPDFAYPLQRFYAPPLLPALIEAGMLAGLPANSAALVPSLLAGCATVAAVWWVGRTWFGPGVGLASAALAALCGLHVAYSAAALTDVLLGLWLILAVDAMTRSLAGGDLRWALAAGGFTGLAWWTKYNGWLLLAIGAAGLVALWLIVWLCGWGNAATGAAAAGQRRLADRRKPSRKPIGGHGHAPAEVSISRPTAWNRQLACLLVTGAVAAVVWAPYYISLQRRGGYAPIAANHAKYVVGLRGWLDGAWRQAVNYEVMEEGLTGPALALALTCVVLIRPLPRRPNGRLHWPRMVWAMLLAAGLLVLLRFAGSLLILAGLATMGFTAAWLRAARAASGTPPAKPLVGMALATAWWAGLSAATFCYWPYARLLIPWLIASWWGAGLFLEEVTRPMGLSADDSLLSRGARAWCLRSAAALWVLAALVTSRWLPSAERMAELRGGTRRSYLAAAREIRAALSQHTRAESDTGRIVYVVGEPALFFQLAAAGEELVVPTQQIANHLEPGAPPAFLVTGPHTERDPAQQEALAQAGADLRELTAFPGKLSPLVELDLGDPRAAAASRESRRFRVFRLRR